MSNDSSMRGDEASPIVFGRRFAHSETFKTLFREGMGLVEETASYLDGDGRIQSRGLARGASLGYATESMRLTTRLMQIASWLLLQRAVNEGELSRLEASSEKRRIRLARQDQVSSEDLLTELPRRLCELVELSLRVQARIRHLDGLIYEPAPGARPSPPKSPVASQIAQLQAALAPASRV